MVNLGLLMVRGLIPALGVRLSTGVALSAVHPSAVKQVCTWSDRRRGRALGVMLGALTLGSALPYLVAAAASRTQVVVGTSILATVGAALFVLGAGSGPHPFSGTALPWPICAARCAAGR
jgi:hypothetical protein